jgi:hypothetical protein
LVAYDEDGIDDTDQFLKGLLSHRGWLRIRAITSQAAVNRYGNAEDQQRVWFNAPTSMDEAKNAPIVESLDKYWEGNEHLYLDVVNLPPEQRPEIIDIEEHQAGMLDDIPNTADYLRDLAERLMGVPVMYGTNQYTSGRTGEKQMMILPGGHVFLGPPAQAGRGIKAHRGTNHEEKEKEKPADQGEDQTTLEGEEGTHSP